MSRTTRLAWNTASNVLRLVASMAVWVAVTPAMLRALGTEGYGLWQLASSVLGFFQLLDVGFGVGVVRTVGQSLGSGDIDQRNRMLSTYLLPGRMWRRYLLGNVVFLVRMARYRRLSGRNQLVEARS
jgi:O-antigen/teichoic acid export membrane protein